MNTLSKALLNIALMALILAPAYAARIKDIGKVQQVRENQLEGIGLVTGLARKGDKDLDLTNQALFNTIREYGLNINLNDVESLNVALVTITAEIGAFADGGDRLDVTVSSIGDAKSLQGGVLLQSPLYGADGRVYAVAQGPVQVGGFIGGDQGGSTVQKNHPTTGLISNGALVERPINTDIVNRASIDIKLHNEDFTTAVRTADAINRIFPAAAQAVNAASINVHVPQTFMGQVPNFIAALGGINVEPDVPAVIVINERTGTIVATENVTISPVAISYGSLVIQVTNNENQAPNQPFAQANQATNNQQTQVAEEEKTGGFKVLPPEDFSKPPSINELADALNSLGVTTRDMINILQTLRDSGALHAELRVK